MNTDLPTPHRSDGRAVDIWATGLFGAALMVAVVALCAASGRSLGLWDETYYIAWIDAPNAYDALVQPFGLFFHGFYRLAGRSLVAVRLLGIGLLVGTGMVMGREAARLARTAAPDVAVAHLPLVGGFAALLYYLLWALTPSYNLLANAGAALVLAGSFGWWARDRDGGGGDWLPALCCGVGGATIFLGKPTSAALAGVLVAVQLALVARRDARRALARAGIAGIAAAVPVVAAIGTTMTPAQFADRVGAGVAALGADYSTLGLLRETARSLLHTPLYLFATVTVLVAAATLPFVPAAARRIGKGAVIAAGLALLGWNGLQVLLLLRVGWMHNIDPWSIAAGTPVLGMVLAVAAIGIAHDGRRVRNPAVAGLLLILAATPYLIAFGTANDLLRQAGMSLFPVLVATVLCARLCFPPAPARGVELASVLLAALLLGWSALRPYNQPASVFAATEPTTLPFTATALALDPATARYARELRAVGRAAGITARTPMLDLSGVSPGTVALLGARAPFFPWIIPFSKRPGVLAGAAWRSLSATERRRTWIVGPIDRRFVGDPDIARLAASGHYRRVAVLRYGPGAGRPPVAFWRPVAP